MGKHPLLVGSSTALAFLATQPAEAAMLPDGEFRPTRCLREFLRRVPLAHLLALDQHHEE
jgi:hypothetical protein